MAKTRSELEDMTKEELINYADDMDIEVHTSWLKTDIVSAILKGQTAAAKEEAQAEPQAAQPADKPADKSADKSADPQVDPKLAEIQTQANKPADYSTQFASSFKDEKK